MHPLKNKPSSPPLEENSCWAPDQRIGDEPDGAIILELQTSGWWDVKKWVLSFGAEARVLEPEELRSEMAEELSRARAGYQ